MGICVVNLIELNLDVVRDSNQHVRRLSQFLFDHSQQQRAFSPIFLVSEHIGLLFNEWIERSPVVISVNPKHPARPLLRSLKPDLIISPFFGMKPLEQIESFKTSRHIVVIPEFVTVDDAEAVSLVGYPEYQLLAQHFRSAFRVVTLNDTTRNKLVSDLHLPSASVITIPFGTTATEAESTFEYQSTTVSVDNTHRQYRAFFLEAAPDIFGDTAKITIPMIPLEAVLQELEALSFKAVFQSDQHKKDTPASDPDVYFQYVDLLLQQEKQALLGKIPLLGLLIRGYLRLRNIGRFWRASTLIAQEIIRRQSVLASKIESGEPR